MLMKACIFSSRASLLQTMDSKQFCLKWDGFQGTVTSLFDQLRHDGELVDITLCCDGQRLRAHRMMLSACSPYFRQLIQVSSSVHGALRVQSLLPTADTGQ